MKKTPLLLLATACLLAGCSGASGGSSDSSLADDVDSTVLEELDDYNYGISVSISGYLNDISIGMSLANHSSYPISFTLSNNPGGDVVVRSDNENVLTVSQSESGTSWTLLTHKQGKAHLIIEDGDGIVHFRKLVTVKKKMSAEEVTASLVDVDLFATVEGFASSTGDLNIYFTEGNTGYISGEESGGVTLNSQSFTYEWDQDYGTPAEETDYWYIYKVSGWTITDFVFDYFAVWNTGDRLHAHTKNGLLGIFEPSSEE